MAAITWGSDIAEAYDATTAEMFAPEVVDPTLDLLTELAAGGKALEFAIGTGRIALPLSLRGVTVCGIELSPHMIDQLRQKPGGREIEVAQGDMARTRLGGGFNLVYLIYNTLMNLTTQDEQVEVFANAAAHLVPGGCFLVEVVVPQLQRIAPGEPGRIFQFEPDHIGIETFDDPVEQISHSHHWMQVDGSLVRHSAPYRYVWPAELDLMARLAGLRLRDRWADWHRSPFTADSSSQIAVFEQLAHEAQVGDSTGELIP